MDEERQHSPADTVSHSEVPLFRDLTHSIYGLLGLTVFSGVFLAVHYVPSFSQAFSSAVRLNEEVPFGWMVRRLHAAGGSALLLLSLVHLGRIFWTGLYKARPGRTWILEVTMALSILWANFTGTLLPLSQAAFWGTATILSSLSSLPWVGPLSVDMLRGGKELGGSALIRFYSMHIGSSVLLGVLLLSYSRRRTAGTSEEGAPRPARNLAFVLAVTISILALATVAPDWVTDALREAADPTRNPERLSLPWYCLFLPEILPFLSGATPCGALVLTVFFFLFLFLLPYLDRNPERSLLLRPFSMALGAALLVVGIYFSLVGAGNAHHGERVVVPEKGLQAAEMRGARVFAEKNCAYCHSIAGMEGRRQGPDMTVVSRRGRSREWVQRFIYNARLYQPGTAMPRYEIPLGDLEALSLYLSVLDPQRGPFRTVDRSRFLEATLYVEAAGEERR